MYGSRKIHIHPMEGHWKFLGEGGVLKSNFLEKMYENKLEFPGGRGVVQNKKPSVGGVWIFWNCTMLFNVSLNIINQIVPKQDREWS